MSNALKYATANTDQETDADRKALLDLIREEAGKDNAPLGRSDSFALHRIRSLLNIPMYGHPVAREIPKLPF